MNMNTEPLRLPALMWAVLVVLLVLLVSVVTGRTFEEAVGLVALALTLAGGVVANAESKRARTDSPATIQTRLAGLAETPLPEDERDHDHGA